MAGRSFYEEGSKLLTSDAFQFVLDNELKRAVRSQLHLTLVTVEASREREGTTVTAEDRVVREVAAVIGKEVRDTDLVGHTDEGTLALVLLDADLEHSTKVIDRLVARIDHTEFQTPLRIAVGAACYPTDALDADTLKRRAMSRPLVHWRSRRSSVDRN